MIIVGVIGAVLVGAVACYYMLRPTKEYRTAMKAWGNDVDRQIAKRGLENRTCGIYMGMRAQLWRTGRNSGERL